MFVAAGSFSFVVLLGQEQLWRGLSSLIICTCLFLHHSLVSSLPLPRVVFLLSLPWVFHGAVFREGCTCEEENMPKKCSRSSVCPYVYLYFYLYFCHLQTVFMPISIQIILPLLCLNICKLLSGQPAVLPDLCIFLSQSAESALE